MRELVQLDGRVAEFEALGVSVYAISVDPPGKVRAFVEARALRLRFACDPERQVVGTLGIEHRGGGPDGATIALPTQILIDRQGDVRWSYRSPDIRVRIDPDRLLAEVRAIVSG